MITLNQHKQHITQTIIRRFSDDKTPRMGLSGFFPSVTTSDKQLGIEVERNRQLMAVDVQRGMGGNLNRFDKYSEKLYVPPYYEEGFNFTDLDRYNVTFGNRNNPSKSDAVNMIRQAGGYLLKIKNKINRAIEKQRADALQIGIVSLKNGDNIDFKRKADSLKVLGTNQTWNDPASTPFDDVLNGARFIREEGLSSGSVINMIYGRDAFREFMNHDQVKEKADIRRIDRLTIGFPKLNDVTGLAFHGQFSVYDFIINIWTYNDVYEDETGLKTPYIDPKNVVMIAEDFVGNTGFAGVPAIVRDKANAEFPEYISMVSGEFYTNNYVDPRIKAHMFEVSSAPLAVPVSIDRLYTIQTLA